jgi:glycosyltransferase involved in cell wall biosynthesis
MQFGCIIPAYNEADRIAAVLAPVVASKLFTRVIVVNDGSSDDTEQAAQMFPSTGVINTGIIYLTTPKGTSSFRKVNEAVL